MKTIRLNKSSSKTALNKDIYLNIDIKDNKVVPLNGDFNEVINLDEQYRIERNTSNIVRLSCTINPICSNVLYNMLTEVVEDEGSNDQKIITGMTGMTSDFTPVQQNEMSTKENVTYHCGLDMFNNHFLRSHTFKSLGSKSGNREFNTIEDKLRNFAEDTVPVSVFVDANTVERNIHLYNTDDIDTFKETVENKLKEQNGWLGFINTPKTDAVEKNKGDYLPIGINRPINNKPSCGFIDLCPERDLFYFTPKFNKYKQREEYNWDYCLTYPSRKTTNLPYFDITSNSLKAFNFDEDYVVNGKASLRIFSFVKHGLIKGDKVTVYLNSVPCIENTEVLKIIDEYTFVVESHETQISNSWYKVSELPSNYSIYSTNKKVVIYKESNNNEDTEVANKFYYVVGNKVNLDDNAQNVSFAKVENNVPCEYYARVFTMLPNWRDCPFEVLTEENVNANKKDYQKYSNHFKNSCGKLGFACNIFGDDISQIVFTDDIDLSYLYDELGLPLSEIYLTIIKNNAGYKEWYDETKPKKDSADIEYSHVFGKVSQGFTLSKESLAFMTENTNYLTGNTLSINSQLNGLTYPIKGESSEDEVTLRGDEINEFYGDIICFSPSTFERQTLEMSDFRFNTAQREKYDGKELKYDVITNDEFDGGEFKCKNESYTLTNHEEGYVYKSHYRIKIHSLSTNLYEVNSKVITKQSLKKVDNQQYSLLTIEPSYLSKDDEIVLHDALLNEYYNASVIDSDDNNPRHSVITIESDIELNHPMRIVKKDKNLPRYALFLKDNSYRFVWREVVHNGLGVNEDVVYPFANNALYVDTLINFFVKRQDPNNYNKLYRGISLRPSSYPYDYDSNKGEIIEDNYVDENNMDCVIDSLFK